MGKLYERIINKRLTVDIEANGGLAGNQFGFRCGRSTVDAIMALRSIAQREARRNYVVLITLDVKNAFGSAPWKGIMQELCKRAVAPYLWLWLFIP